MIIRLILLVCFSAGSVGIQAYNWNDILTKVGLLFEIIPIGLMYSSLFLENFGSNYHS